MVEGVRSVVVCYGQSEAIRRFLAVADGVVLVGAVADGDSRALADGIHRAVVCENDARANFVLLVARTSRVGSQSLMTVWMGLVTVSIRFEFGR